MNRIFTAGGVLIILAILSSCGLALAYDTPAGIPSTAMNALRSNMFSQDKIPYSAVRGYATFFENLLDYVVTKIIAPNVKYNPRINIVEIGGWGIPNFYFLIAFLIILMIVLGTLFRKAIRSEALWDDIISIFVFLAVVSVVRRSLVIAGYSDWAGLVTFILVASFVAISLLSGRGSVLNDFRAFAIGLTGLLLILHLFFPSETANGLYETMLRIKNLGTAIFVDRNLLMLPLWIVAVLWCVWSNIQTYGLTRRAQQAQR